MTHISAHTDMGHGAPGRLCVPGIHLCVFGILHRLSIVLPPAVLVER